MQCIIVTRSSENFVNHAVQQTGKSTTCALDNSTTLCNWISLPHPLIGSSEHHLCPHSLGGNTIHSPKILYSTRSSGNWHNIIPSMDNSIIPFSDKFSYSLIACIFHSCIGVLTISLRHYDKLLMRRYNPFIEHTTNTSIYQKTSALLVIQMT